MIEIRPKSLFGKESYISEQTQMNLVARQMSGAMSLLYPFEHTGKEFLLRYPSSPLKFQFLPKPEKLEKAKELVTNSYRRMKEIGV